MFEAVDAKYSLIASLKRGTAKPFVFPGGQKVKIRGSMLLLKGLKSEKIASTDLKIKS